jgi:hypothetical protein
MPCIVISVPSALRHTWRKVEPTFSSFSHTTIDQPGGPRSQRSSNSGLAIASKTRVRGASKTHVITISRSVGVVTFKRHYRQDPQQARLKHRELRARVCTWQERVFPAPPAAPLDTAPPIAITLRRISLASWDSHVRFPEPSEKTMNRAFKDPVMALSVHQRRGRQDDSPCRRCSSPIE